MLFSILPDYMILIGISTFPLDVFISYSIIIITILNGFSIMS